MMSWQQSLQVAIRSLRREEQSILKNLDSVRDRISELQSVSKAIGARGRGRGGAVRRTRRLSAKGRAAISRAAKQRWAQYRAQKGK
jgi:hypothetical protein